MRWRATHRSYIVFCSLLLYRSLHYSERTNECWFCAAFKKRRESTESMYGDTSLFGCVRLDKEGATSMQLVLDVKRRQKVIVTSCMLVAPSLSSRTHPNNDVSPYIDSVRLVPFLACCTKSVYWLMTVLIFQWLKHVGHCERGFVADSQRRFAVTTLHKGDERKYVSRS